MTRLRRGMRVKVYQQPLDRGGYEGVAFLRDKLRSYGEDARLERWLVLFAGPDGECPVERLVHPDDALDPPEAGEVSDV